jgi:hypothetical protein
MKVVFLGEKSLDAADEQMMKRGEKKIIDFRYSDLNAFKLEFPFPFHMRPSVTFPFFLLCHTLDVDVNILFGGRDLHE